MQAQSVTFILPPKGGNNMPIENSPHRSSQLACTENLFKLWNQAIAQRKNIEKDLPQIGSLSAIGIRTPHLSQPHLYYIRLHANMQQKAMTFILPPIGGQ